MYSPRNNKHLYRVSSVLLCLFLITIPQPALGRPTASLAAGTGEPREFAAEDILSTSFTLDMPSTSVDTPIPLPRFCDGVTPPGETPPACCIFGYAYYNDEPVGGINIRIESPSGFVETTTKAGGSSPQPYYGVDLSSFPLSASAGDVIAITASYRDMISIRTWTVQSYGQQVDIGLVDGYRATEPLLTNEFGLTIVRPTDVRPLSSTGIPFGSAAIITSTLWNPRSTYASDLDNDGDLDILSASIDDDKIAWYESDGGSPPAFTSHVVTAAADGAFGVHAADIDGDGDMDVLSASLYADEIAWYENDGGYPPSFTSYVVTNTADEAVSVYAADLDGDGDLDVISASRGDDRVAWYENNGSSPPAFTAHTITTGADLVISVYAADMDGDGDLDVLSASRNDNTIAWYENGGGPSPVFTAHAITTAAYGARSVYAADIDRDGDMDVLAASLNDHTIAWYENNHDAPLTFTPHVVATHTTLEAAIVYAADVDHDGDIDILAGFRDDTSNGEIVWYENDGSSAPAFAAHLVADDVLNAFSVLAADIEGDGDADILSVKTLNGEADDQIVWYENRTIHRSAAFPIQSIITNSADEAKSVYAADIDGDGDVDVLSASGRDDTIAWYENDGSPLPTFVSHVIANAADGAFAVYAADLDRDGDIDVLSASENDDKIAWYENDGEASPAFTSHTITTTADSARSVFVTDLDNDGDMDILSASANDDKIAWYENDGGTPPVFASHTITTIADSARSVFAIDLDNDGDIDVLSASADDGKIAWYESNGASSPTFTSHTVISGATGSDSVYATDLDADGDVDILATSWQSDTVAWYENDGASLPVFTSHAIITNADGAVSVYAADLDHDGDIDILSASARDNRIRWHENDGGSPPVFNAHVIAYDSNWVFSVYPADIDNDGDLDVLSAAWQDDAIAWYENQGGQFALSAADSAPFSILTGQQDDILRIVATHRGRAGDTDVELASFELLFEDITGDPLSTVQANNLLETLYVYRDDRSGSFEPLTDTLVTTVDALELVTGTLAVPLVDQDPSARLSFGSPVTFFVAVEFTDNATGQTPNQFRIVHLAGQDDIAQDWDHGLSLTPESGSGGASSICSAPTMYHPEYVVPFGTGTDRTFALAWGDANNDGLPDLAVGNHGQDQICWNNGDLSFQCESAFGSGLTFDVEWGDMNGDNWLDLVVARASGQANQVCLNNEGRDFTCSTFSTCSGAPGDKICTSALGDIDQDGDLDIVLGTFYAGWYAAPDVVYYNQGDATFPVTTTTCTTGSTLTRDLKVGDLNDDDYPDLVVADNIRDYLCINHDGVLSERRLLPSGTSFSTALGDADGDGDLDIAMGANFGAQDTLYLNDGSGLFPTAVPFHRAQRTYSLAFGDIDGDGRLDLASGDYYRLTVFFNVPTTAAPGMALVQAGYLDPKVAAVNSVAFADMDNDGDQDLAEASDRHQNVVFLNARSRSADFTSSIMNCGLALDVQFVDLSIGRLVSWTWDFGDGEISGARHPLHIYWDAGVYTVTLTASGPDGSCIETKFNYIDASAGKSWTFMLYLAGDNNLDMLMQYARRKLERVIAYANVRVLVLIDGRGSNDTWRYDIQPHGNYTDGANRWHMGELNMGDPQTLSDFVTWAYDNYPADYYYLSIANHGRGTTGIAWDDTSGSDKLSPRELEMALRNATENGARPIDVVHYDACLMAMLENAYQIRDLADYFVASQNLGWSAFAYDRYAMFGCMTPEQLAVAIVDSYHGVMSILPHTISAVDLERVGTLESAVNALSTALITDIGAYTDVISSTYKEAQKFDSKEYLKITGDEDYLDLYHLAELLEQKVSDSTIKSRSQDVMDAIHSCVIAEHHKSGTYLRHPYWDLENAHGVSIYFPPSCGGWGYADYSNDYSFAADSQWDEFLQAYCDASSLPPLQPLDPGRPQILGGYLIHLPIILGND